MNDSPVDCQNVSVTESQREPRRPEKTSAYRPPFVRNRRLFFRDVVGAIPYHKISLFSVGEAFRLPKTNDYSVQKREAKRLPYRLIFKHENSFIFGSPGRSTPTKDSLTLRSAFHNHFGDVGENQITVLIEHGKGEFHNAVFGVALGEGRYGASTC